MKLAFLILIDTAVTFCSFGQSSLHMSLLGRWESINNAHTNHDLQITLDFDEHRRMEIIENQIVDDPYQLFNIKGHHYIYFGVPALSKTPRLDQVHKITLKGDTLMIENYHVRHPSKSAVRNYFLKVNEAKQ